MFGKGLIDLEIWCSSTISVATNLRFFPISFYFSHRFSAEFWTHYCFYHFAEGEEARQPKVALCDTVHTLWLGVVSFVSCWNAKDSITSIFEASELVKQVVQYMNLTLHKGSSFQPALFKRFVNIYNVAGVLLSLCLLFSWKLVKICIQRREREREGKKPFLCVKIPLTGIGTGLWIRNVSRILWFTNSINCISWND